MLKSEVWHQLGLMTLPIIVLFAVSATTEPSETKPFSNESKNSGNVAFDLPLKDRKRALWHPQVKSKKG